MLTSTNPTVDMEFGKRNEPVAISKFTAQTGKEVFPSGLFVHSEFPFLAASPDGIIDEENTVEAKCFSAVARSKGDLVQQVKQGKVKCLQYVNERLQLKKDHEYFYQIQRQLACSKRKVCYFIGYVGDHNELMIEEIKFDPEIWQAMLTKLIKFYKYCLAPNIVMRHKKTYDNCLMVHQKENNKKEKKAMIKKNKQVLCNVVENKKIM